jgi:murein biosynthesis integral membrane protein MurJ
MSGSALFNFVRGILSRLLAVKSSRGVSFTLSFMAMLSKPLGYIRTLLIAWMFGTSAGMDSFHAASGIVALFAGNIGMAVESAVLPEMERIRRETGGESGCDSLFAAVAWLLLLVVVLICAAMALFPEVLIKFFASGFDPERIRTGVLMIWWLMPFAVMNMLRPMVDTWALFTERYTLSSICGLAFNFVAIPTLLLLQRVVGVYSVAACMSFGNAATFLIFFFGLRGVPLRVRMESVRAGSLSRVVLNALFSMLIISSWTLYMIVDRYFASRLPVGSISAISYGGMIQGLMSLIIVTPLTVFLAKVSRLVAESPEEAGCVVRQTIALVVAYSLPMGFISASAAKPIISVVYGWGNFGYNSVNMTAICLAGYNIGLVFVVAGLVLYRYAQAQQRLGRMIHLFYVLVGIGALLDWLMVGRWGLWGLALATSITNMLSFIVYYKVMMDDSLTAFLVRSKFFWQLAAVSVFTAAVWWSGRLGMIVQSVSAAAAAAVYLFAAERAGLMPLVPEHWRPRGLFSFMFQKTIFLFKKT